MDVVLFSPSPAPITTAPPARPQLRETLCTYQGLTLYRQSWAVVVGIDQFQNPKVPPLNYAVNDARALVPLGFPERNITLLLNQQAARGEIERV